LFGDAVETAREHIELARHRHPNDELLRLVNYVGKPARLADEAFVRANERGFVFGIDEHTVDEVREVVTGASVDRPLGAELLVADEDLLDDDIKRAIALRGGCEQADRFVAGV